MPKNEWDDFSDVGNFAADKFVAESPDMPPVAITESIVSEPEKNDGFVCTVRIDDNHTGVTIGKSSVIGKRAYQQDAIITDDDYVYSERKIAVAILCDGMGGLSGGEQASQICAAALYQELHHLTMKDNIPAAFHNIVPMLDRDVCSLCDEAGNPLKAGTTMVGAMIVNGGLYWVSVGDSHAYILRNNQLVCITKEHNLMMLLRQKVDRGDMTEAEAQSHPQKEALISYIGMGGVKYIDMNQKPLPLQHNDYVIICSDGLYRTVSDREISQIVTSFGADVQSAADALTEAAMAKGKKHQDNTSVIVMLYQQSG